MPTIAEKIEAVLHEAAGLKQAVRDTNTKNSQLHQRMSQLQAELDQCEHLIDFEVARAAKLDSAVGDFSNAAADDKPSSHAAAQPPRAVMTETLRNAVAAAGNELEAAHQAWVDVSSKKIRTEQALNKQLAANETAAARVKSREKQVAQALKEATHAARVVRERENELSGLREEIEKVLEEVTSIDKRSRVLADRARVAEATAQQNYTRRTQQKDRAVAEMDAAEKRQQQIETLRRENRRMIQTLLARNFSIGSLSIADPLLKVPQETADGAPSAANQSARRVEGSEAADASAEARRATEEALLETMERLIHSVATRASAGRSGAYAHS